MHGPATVPKSGVRSLALSRGKIRYLDTGKIWSFQARKFKWLLENNNLKRNSRESGVKSNLNTN